MRTCSTTWPRSHFRGPRRGAGLLQRSPTARVAIVTTLRNIPKQMLSSFVGWHLRLGFVRLYLYFDDPNDAGIADARQLCREAQQHGYGADCVHLIPVDHTIQSEWSTLETARRWDLWAGEDLWAAVSHHVEVRQLLNAEHALRRAYADGDVEWLLHIDSGDTTRPGGAGRMALNPSD